MTTETRLSPEQIISYYVNGFLALDRIVSDAELPRLVEIYDDLFARKAGYSAGDHLDLAGAEQEGQKPKLPQMTYVTRYAPELKDFEFYKTAESIGRQLLGEDCTIYGEHAINKPGPDGDVTPWHQDEAYWDPGFHYHSLSIWIPLQDVSEENGCMHFLPGSHKQSVLNHRSIGGDVRVHGLEVDEPDLDLSDSVAVPLPAGAATVHANRTLHYTGPNTLNANRRALIIMAQLQPRKNPLPRRFPWNEIKQTAREQRVRQSAGMAQGM